LDVSQTKVVQDERYKAAMSLARGAAPGFRRWLADEYKRRPKPARRPATADFLWDAWHWLRRSIGFPSAEAAAQGAWDRTVRQWLEANQ